MQEVREKPDRILCSDRLKACDNTVGCNASYMREHHFFEAWLFINHLALQLLYDSLDVIARNQNYSDDLKA